MLIVALICSLWLTAVGQQAESGWLNPYDMLNYDSTTKTMRKPAEDSCHAELTSYKQQVADLQKQIGVFVLIIIAIICTQLGLMVSWFVQLGRLFTPCFFIIVSWEWFDQYKIAFAEHQKNIVKMGMINAECTGVTIDWSDGLKEWFRSTWTLQDGPCKQYYEAVLVSPILLVPPTEAISVTITTFITEPLKHFGQGISEFLRTHLEALPVTLLIPFLFIVATVMYMYGSVQTAFQHAVMAFLRHPRSSPPPELEQPQPRMRVDDCDPFAGGDTPAQQHAPRYGADEARLQKHGESQRRSRGPQEDPGQEVIETLRTINSHEDETDAEQREVVPEPEHNLSAESNSENQQEKQELLQGASGSTVGANKTKSEPKPAQSDSPQLKNKPSDGNKNLSQDEPDGDVAAARSQQTGRQPVGEVLEVSSEDTDSSLPRFISFKGNENLSQDEQHGDGTASKRQPVVKDLEALLEDTASLSWQAHAKTQVSVEERRPAKAE